jgi:uncharacterized membrane protein
MNYSFWADEAFIASVASQLNRNIGSFSSILNLLPYQKLYVVIIALFFKVFGTSEFIARLPAFLFFLLGVTVIFILGKKLSNLSGGLLTSFVYGLSHLNLAYATQAKPYAALETLTLLIILLLLKLTSINGKAALKYHIAIAILLCVTVGLHVIGVLLWILYSIAVVVRLKGYWLKSWKVKRLQITRFLNFKPTNLLIFLAFVVFVGFVLSAVWPYIPIKLFPYNNSYQVLKLFTYKYTFILVFSCLGFLITFKKHRVLGWGIVVYSLTLLVLASFQQYVFNIRYVLTLFGIMFLYFGVFWAELGKQLIPSRAWIIPLGVIIGLYITGYQITKIPQAYYNPNTDKYGDIQIANYKDFFSKLKARFPQYRTMYVINDNFDTEGWYFQRFSNAYFMKFTPKPYRHPVVHTYIYGSLGDFNKLMAQHPSGLLIMEDWQSFLPDDVKEYAKKHLKLEFRVESLKEAPNDPWPLALYSWGL